MALAVAAVVNRISNAKFERVSTFVKNQSQNLFFGPIIELYIQGYFEFLVAIYLSLSIDFYGLGYDKLSGEVLSRYVSFVSIVFALVFMPVCLIYILLIDGSKLKD